MDDIAPIPVNRRILVIDDMTAIHRDIAKILQPPRHEADELLRAKAAALFDGFPLPPLENLPEGFELEFAHQGEEGVALAQAAAEAGRPFALAFVDGRMPPGCDGIETIRRLWAVRPDLQIVICTAYADYSWEEIVGLLGASDSLVILKKPFDVIEVRQLAESMTRRWTRNEEVRLQLQDLNRLLESHGEAFGHDPVSPPIPPGSTAPTLKPATLNGVARLLEGAGETSHGILEQLQNSKISCIGRLAAMLREHESQLGAFGGKLPARLAQLAAELANERNSAVHEIAFLQHNLKRIRSFVRPAAPTHPDSRPPVHAARPAPPASPQS